MIVWSRRYRIENLNKRTLVGVIEADALHNFTHNIVVVGLGARGDLTEDLDHTSGDSGFCKEEKKWWQACENVSVGWGGDGIPPKEGNRVARCPKAKKKIDEHAPHATLA